MKTPNKCIKCQRELMYDMTSSRSKYIFYCNDEKDHKFWCFGDLNKKILGVSIQIVGDLHIFWHFESKRCKLYDGPRGDGSKIADKYIPYFEPDFTDYDKLVEKMKMIINFL